MSNKTTAPPCECCHLSETGYYVRDCDCGNSGDTIDAATWCANQVVNTNPDTVTISRECAERSHVRASYYLQAAYNKAVGPEALKDFNELTKALEVQGE